MICSTARADCGCSDAKLRVCAKAFAPVDPGNPADLRFSHVSAGPPCDTAEPYVPDCAAFTAFCIFDDASSSSKNADGPDFKIVDSIVVVDVEASGRAETATACGATSGAGALRDCDESIDGEPFGAETVGMELPCCPTPEQPAAIEAIVTSVPARKRADKQTFTGRDLYRAIRPLDHPPQPKRLKSIGNTTVRSRARGKESKRLGESAGCVGESANGGSPIRGNFESLNYRMWSSPP